MKERPILFSAPMVRALLAGTKTQTRRFITPQPAVRPIGWGTFDDNPKMRTLRCPYGVPGDRLWVRETHAVLRMKEHGVVAYRASCEGDAFDYFDPFRSTLQSIEVKKWKPSIFMRRHESRITLEVTGVRVERLHDISESDAIAEGLEDRGRDGWQWPTAPLEVVWGMARDCYLAGWDTINEKRAPAKSNPWVWVVSFQRAAPP